MYTDIVFGFLLLSGICSSVGNPPRNTSFTSSPSDAPIELATELPVVPATVKTSGNEPNREDFASPLIDKRPDANYSTENSKFPSEVTDSAREKTFPEGQTTEILSYIKEIDPGESVTFPQAAADGRNVSAKNDTKLEVYISKQQDILDLDIQETAGFVAIGILILAVVGYIGLVLWRRYLQNKYDSQTLITEDVYDISDLRYFEI